jgi:hypothetical protein
VLIDTALSEDRNVIKKKIKDILKYKALQKTYSAFGVKNKAMPVITGASGTIFDHSGYSLATHGENTKSKTTENCHTRHCKHISENTNSS